MDFIDHFSPPFSLQVAEEAVWSHGQEPRGQVGASPQTRQQSVVAFLAACDVGPTCGPPVTAGGPRRWKQIKMSWKSVSQPWQGSALNHNPCRLTHTCVICLSASHACSINSRPLSERICSRTNSLPPPDKQQEVMRWAGRGELPVSCENSSSISSEKAWTEWGDELDLAAIAVIDPKTLTMHWNIDQSFGPSTCYSCFLPRSISNG